MTREQTLSVIHRLVSRSAVDAGIAALLAEHVGKLNTLRRATQTASPEV